MQPGLCLYNHVFGISDCDGTSYVRRTQSILEWASITDELLQYSKKGPSLPESKQKLEVSVQELPHSPKNGIITNQFHPFLHLCLASIGCECNVNNYSIMLCLGACGASA